MNSGVAKSIRRCWPKVYKQFMNASSGSKMLGEISPIFINADLIIVNCYTQVYYGHNGRFADINAIKSCLQKTIKVMNLYDHNILFMPRIGCGLGGLDWEREVLPIVEKVSQNFPELYINIVDLPSRSKNE